MSEKSRRTITLRPADEAVDEPLLYRLYASSRDLEMSMVDWDEATKETFLRQQMRAQLLHYPDAYPQTTHDIVLLNGEPVGRLYMGRDEDYIQLMDITILAEHRSAGIGSYLMQGLFEESVRTNKPISLQVFQLNTGAQRFYQRFGFREIGTQGPNIVMEWKPGTSPS